MWAHKPGMWNAADIRLRGLQQLAVSKHGMALEEPYLERTYIYCTSKEGNPPAKQVDLSSVLLPPMLAPVSSRIQGAGGAVGSVGPPAPGPLLGGPEPHPTRPPSRTVLGVTAQ